MSWDRGLNPNDLDRWITGNYGEDRFKDEILNDGSEDLMPPDDDRPRCEICGRVLKEEDVSYCGGCKSEPDNHEHEEGGEG